MEDTYQIYVKFLDGKYRSLNFSSPSIPVLAIKNRIRELAGVPIAEQRLVTGTKQLEDSSLLHPTDGTHWYPELHLLLRLRGGKGGFGSLLRGAATKAGQKKTNNFDACRDMSGRRLRHVNAEKKLEEWQAEAEDRRLEKIAEEFIKKKVKVAAKKGGASGDAEKYVEKYRDDSAKCMEEVEKSVREAIGSYASSKRKIAVGGLSASDAKKLKIWMGKRAMGDSDSDSDDTDEDGNDENEEEKNDKSVIIDDGSWSDSNKEREGSLGSVTGRKLDGESSGGVSSETGSEEEETAIRSPFSEPRMVDPGMVGCETNDAGEPALVTHGERMVGNENLSFSADAVILGTEDFKAKKRECNEPDIGISEGLIGQPLNVSSAGDGGTLERGTTVLEVSLNLESKQVVYEETMVMSTDVSDVVKKLNLDELNSAKGLEALGMERLKSELQSRGLKCGGTLQERAARLFLLKTTPLDMLPKKLLAKK
ncbi:hypothetical protein U1Q18_023711 [Sarracenia purpurea var. burkii]